jgi:AraC-like DNA-binding protein
MAHNSRCRIFIMFPVRRDQSESLERQIGWRTIRYLPMRAITKNLRHTHMVGDDTPEQIIVDSSCAQLRKAGIWSAGLSDAGRGYLMVRVRPTFEQLLVCVGGEGVVLIEDRWRPCGTGEAYIMPLLANNAFRTVGRRRWQFCWIVYAEPKPGLLPAIGGDCSRLIKADPRGLWSSIEGLYREATGLAEAILLDSWIKLMRAHAARIIDPYQERDPLWRVWAAVTADLAAVWSTDRLADHAMVSAEQVRRLCLRHTGRSPMEHVTYLRMAQAGALLESTPMKIAAIAQAVGYANPFAFSTAFRRINGVSPAAWRNAMNMKKDGRRR